MAKIIINYNEIGGTLNGLIVPYYARRIPGSEIETQDFSIPWSQVTSDEAVEAAIIADAREKLSGTTADLVVLAQRVRVVPAT